MDGSNGSPNPDGRHRRSVATRIFYMRKPNCQVFARKKSAPPEKTMCPVFLRAVPS